MRTILWGGVLLFALGLATGCGKAPDAPNAKPGAPVAGPKSNDAKPAVYTY
jgi:hypothetical protein